MKKVVFALILLFTCSSIFAQLNIGAPGAIKTAPFKKKDIEAFQSATTCFVIREIDKENKKMIEGILAEVWKFNKYKIIDFAEYVTESKKPDNIFFGLRSYNRNAEYVSSADLYGKYATSSELKIIMWKNGDKADASNIDEQVIASLDVYIPYDIYKAVKEVQSLAAFEYVCKSPTVVPDWSWGLLKNNLQLINACLVVNKPHWQFENDVNKDQIGKLASAKLYVEEKGTERYDKRDKASPIEKYGYKYELISKENLSKLILESQVPIYYMIIDIGGSSKVITIINSKTGEIIYSQYKGQAYYFKEKDVDALMDEIK
jgi:hypothetical protein